MLHADVAYSFCCYLKFRNFKAGGAGVVDYCASKFAAVGLDEALRLEFKQSGKTGWWHPSILSFAYFVLFYQECTPRACARTSSTRACLQASKPSLMAHD